MFGVLTAKGSFQGEAQSGNFSMFYAILLEHSSLYLDIDTGDSIQEWIDRHLSSINKNGFWGDSKDITYLQFQNGYHQYEMFDYFNVNNNLHDIAAQNVMKLSDKNGFFAPYPGGGGCFDYDAVFIISTSGDKIIKESRCQLKKTMSSILSAQNNDGGFSESQFIRPRSLNNAHLMIRHIVNSDNALSRLECFKYGLTLFRSKHNHINTHWSNNTREWGESNLWDSWFRMLTIARINSMTSEECKNNWGFINYPGIGHF